MPSNLKDILRRSNLGQIEKKGIVKVLVALNISDPDQACLERFRALGLSIEKIIKNKIIGTIDVNNLPVLEADDQVAETEISVTLERHS